MMSKQHSKHWEFTNKILLHFLPSILYCFALTCIINVGLPQQGK